MAYTSKRDGVTTSWFDAAKTQLKSVRWSDGRCRWMLSLEIFRASSLAFGPDAQTHRLAIFRGEREPNRKSTRHPLYRWAHPGLHPIPPLDTWPAPAVSFLTLCQLQSIRLTFTIPDHSEKA